MKLAYEDIILDDGLGPAFKWFIIASVVLHLCFFYFAVDVLPRLKSPRRPPEQIYTVNLISLPPSSGGSAPVETSPTPGPEVSPPAPAPEPAQPEPAAAVETPPPAPEPPKPEPAAVIEPEPTQLVPLGPPKPPEPELKKADAPPPKPEVKKPEPPKPEVKKIEKPTKKVKPKVDPDKELQKALARVKRKVRTEDEKKHLDSALAELADKRTSAGDTSSSGEIGVRGTGPVTELDARMRDYIRTMLNIITANLQMPAESMVGDKNVKATYVIRVDRTGRIIKGWFETKSGQKNFDLAIEDAFGRIRSFGAVPDVYKGPVFEIGWRFDPSGVMRR